MNPPTAGQLPLTSRSYHTKECHLDFILTKENYFGVYKRLIKNNMDFSESQIKRSANGKDGMGQPLLPLVQERSEYPDAGYPPPGMYPNASDYHGQQYGAPVGPGPYVVNGSYPGFQVVTVQPTVVTTTTPLLNPLPDYMCYSVFTMLCCCLPLGVAALVYSITVSIHRNDLHF